jgi:hypothetical protein
MIELASLIEVRIELWTIYPDTSMHFERFF